MNASNKVSHSRSPPARSRYTLGEMDNLMNSSSADPLSEDPSVLAFFDSLLEEGESGSIFYDSSLTDPEDDDLSSPSSLSFPRALMELPFFGVWLSHNESDDSDATPTDSELSFANTSSLEPPWSEDELETVDQELRETYYRGDLDERSSYDSSDHTSGDSRGCNEGDGREGRIFYHHDDEVGEGKKSRKRKKEEDEQVCNGVSNSAPDRDLQVSSGSNNSRSSSSWSGSQSEPTRQQPSGKVKKKASSKDRSSSSANCHSDRTLLNGDGGVKNRRHQPRRKVKSAQPNLSCDLGETAMATNSHTTTASGSSAPTGESHSQNSGACGSRNAGGGTSSRNGGAGSSRHAQTSGACASGINGGTNSGPSRKWTKKNSIRQQQAAGTASNNYGQYTAEDFLKPIPPSSFYTKKGPPPPQ